MNELITVYSAEVLRRLRSRSFIMGLLIGAAGLVLMIRLPQYIDSIQNTSYRVVLAGDASIIRQARPLLTKDYNIVAVQPGLVHPTQADLQARGGASAVFVLMRGAHGLNVVAYAKDPSSINATRLRRDLLTLQLGFATNLSADRIGALVKMPVTVQPLASKFGTAEQADQARGIAMLLLILLYLLIILNSQLLMTSVAEEKTSRIAELLVSAVNPTTLLAAKIAASASLALVQMAVWAAIGFAAGAQSNIASTSVDTANAAAASFSFSNVPPGDIAGFIVFFILGYLQTAVMFAAIGSLINRTEDIGSIGGPFFMPIVAAFVIAIMALNVPDAPIVIAASFIPFVAPFVMFARIVVTTVPTWQLVLSFAINAAAIYGIAILGGRVYRVGMLLYGRAPKLSQLLRTLRT